VPNEIYVCVGTYIFHLAHTFGKYESTHIGTYIFHLAHTLAHTYFIWHIQYFNFKLMKYVCAKNKTEKK